MRGKPILAAVPAASCGAEATTATSAHTLRIIRETRSNRDLLSTTLAHDRHSNPHAMPEVALAADLRRHTALTTMSHIAPDQAEEELRSFCGSVGWGEWEEELMLTLRSRASAPLLAGHGDAGHRFVFSPSARTGFWTLARGSLRGKGRLLPVGIEILTDLARERALLR